MKHSRLCLGSFDTNGKRALRHQCGGDLQGFGFRIKG